MRAEIIGHSASITPLCPAGHLPLKGGDRQVAIFHSHNDRGANGRAHPISPLEGEMSGRTEGVSATHHHSRISRHDRHPASQSQ
ncbi:hypothetical protein F3Y33_05300 [Rhizobium sp. BG6]|nr:hypothetical protein F3Y33_05300 [Rhizobium sp. BG6]